MRRDDRDIIKQLEYEPAKAVEVAGGGKLNVGLLGRLKKKKMAAQAHVAIEETMGYKTGVRTHAMLPLVSVPRL